MRLNAGAVIGWALILGGAALVLVGGQGWHFDGRHVIVAAGAVVAWIFTGPAGPAGAEHTPHTTEGAH